MQRGHHMPHEDKPQHSCRRADRHRAPMFGASMKRLGPPPHHRHTTQPHMHPGQAYTLPLMKSSQRQTRRPTQKPLAVQRATYTSRSYHPHTVTTMAAHRLSSLHWKRTCAETQTGEPACNSCQNSARIYITYTSLDVPAGMWVCLLQCSWPFPEQQQTNAKTATTPWLSNSSHSRCISSRM
jgi:hypothetical protein